MKPILLLVIVCLLVAAAFTGPAAAPPDKPLLGGKNLAVLTYDINAKPEALNNPKLLDALDAHPGKGRWRIVESTAVFNDDQPDFKTLMADPGRKSADWLTTGNSKGVGHSEVLPTDEAKIEQLIGKYAK